jgi:aryl-alcohol dehydrogenase-like predicted oxidoreductase
MTLRPEPYLALDNRAIHDGLAALGREAEARAVAMSSLAMAWTLAHPCVDAIVAGPRRPQHIDDAVAALDVMLSAEDVVRLQESFGPRAR